MKKIESFKMPFQTTHFNKRQRVWVIFTAGSLAAYCYGKFRGKGRYIKAWVKWEAKYKINPLFQEFDVDDSFAKRVFY